MFLLREANRVNRCLSKLAGSDRPQKLGNPASGVENMDDSSYWVPHPRTGIYFPEGHESVMDNVPKGAASLNQIQTYWLRNIDGVEKPDPNTSPDHHFYTNF